MKNKNSFGPITIKDRISDIIAEYLCDDKSSSLTFYNDLMDELKSWQKYHQDNLDKVNSIIHLVNGQSVVSSTLENDWENHYYPHPNQPVYTEEELAAMCDKAASDQEKEKCLEYNLRESEYYDKERNWDDFWENKHL